MTVTICPLHGATCDRWPANDTLTPTMPAPTGDRDLDTVMQSAAYLDALLTPALSGAR